MHPSAKALGDIVAQAFANASTLVVDVGGLNVNGSLREYFEPTGARFVCVDMEAHPSVDIVVPPGVALPFETGSVDIVVSTSCFEHDPCFWLSFKELCRIVKPGGLIYINAPMAGPYHRYPGDNWRFYTDSAQALASWSAKPVYLADNVTAALNTSTSVEGVRAALQDNVYPVIVEEQFFAGPWKLPDPLNWTDCVMLFRRVVNVPPSASTIVLDRDAVFGRRVCAAAEARGIPVFKQHKLF
jgi:SAM-dependent methyltransferase